MTHQNWMVRKIMELYYNSIQDICGYLEILTNNNNNNNNNNNILLIQKAKHLT